MTPAGRRFGGGSIARNPAFARGFLLAQFTEAAHMEEMFAIAALWVFLALLSAVLASHLRISLALMEILVGIAAAAAIGHFYGGEAMGADLSWLRFIASTGAVLLTFLAGAELEPAVMRMKWKEVTIVGLAGFFAPFLGCTAVAYYALGWSAQSSWLAGVALSTTSMAVVYAVMLEFGLNKTDFGKGVMGACFINDLGTVIALGLLFSPFTIRTAIFGGGCAAAIVLLPFITRKISARYAHKTAAMRTKWIFFVLFGLGALALWAGSEAVLPAYVAGMVLSGTIGADAAYVRRLRTMTIGFLTPFYFLRAGSFVSLPALIAAPLIFLALLAGKVFSKIFGLFFIIRKFRRDPRERWYYTLLMSTGLTFGTISALYGLSNGIISKEQYSYLVAVVIGSAVIPTIIANAIFLPRHLMAKTDKDSGRVPDAVNPKPEGTAQAEQ
jgi:glutathione-regulated potassium-efflux system ancillary protein KefC